MSPVQAYSLDMAVKSSFKTGSERVLVPRSRKLSVGFYTDSKAKWALNCQHWHLNQEPVKNFAHGARINYFFGTLLNRWQRWQIGNLNKHLRGLDQGVRLDLLPKLPSIITLNNYSKAPWTLYFESFFGVIVLWIQGNSCIQFEPTDASWSVLKMLG